MKSLSRMFSTVVYGGLLVCVPGMMAQATALQAAEPISSFSTQNVILSSGDSIRVTFFDMAELNVDHIDVSVDGTVKLPLVGDLHLGGLSPSSAAHLIDDAYRMGKFVRNPQATVLILSFALNGVSVMGEVTKPGNYPVTGPRTLVDMIAMAGGLTVSADTRITLQHANGTISEPISLPLNDGARTLRDDVSVVPGDKIVAQRAGTIYVLGDVSRAGGYLMQYEGRITVLQAIAQAGGSSRVSGERSAYIIRKDGDAVRTERLPLRAMYKGETPDFALSAGDVIYVPSSNTRNFIFNAPQILGTLAGAAIYSVNR
jgi:polysaccharide export outer membrane protein